MSEHVVYFNETLASMQWQVFPPDCIGYAIAVFRRKEDARTYAAFLDSGASSADAALGRQVREAAAAMGVEAGRVGEVLPDVVAMLRRIASAPPACPECGCNYLGFDGISGTYSEENHTVAVACRNCKARQVVSKAAWDRDEYSGMAHVDYECAAAILARLSPAPERDAKENSNG